MHKHPLLDNNKIMQRVTLHLRHIFNIPNRKNIIMVLYFNVPFSPVATVGRATMAKLYVFTYVNEISRTRPRCAVILTIEMKVVTYLI